MRRERPVVSGRACFGMYSPCDGSDSPSPRRSTEYHRSRTSPGPPVIAEHALPRINKWEQSDMRTHINGQQSTNVQIHSYINFRRWLNQFHQHAGTVFAHKITIPASLSRKLSYSVGKTTDPWRLSSQIFWVYVSQIYSHTHKHAHPFYDNFKLALTPLSLINKTLWRPRKKKETTLAHIDRRLSRSLVCLWGEYWVGLFSPPEERFSTEMRPFAGFTNKRISLAWGDGTTPENVQKRHMSPHIPCLRTGIPPKKHEFLPCPQPVQWLLTRSWPKSWHVWLIDVLSSNASAKHSNTEWIRGVPKYRWNNSIQFL